MARADARRNRDRILQVAEQVFGDGGEAASTEEVARRAGVGIGTVFRHFPTKAALLEAVFIGHLERLRDHGRSLLEAQDAGAAFFGYLTHAVRDASVKLTLAQALAGTGIDVHGVAGATSQQVRETLADLLERARRSGAVRSDVQLPEVYGLLVAVSQAARLPTVDEAAAQRMLGVVIEGLRAR